MGTVYDVIIIGSGPAGLSAGIYAGRALLKTLIIEKSKAGGQAAITDEIANYPGAVAEETGPSLVDKMVKQAQRFGVEQLKADVTEVDFTGTVKKVKCGDAEYQCTAVIIATGAFPG